VHSLKNILELFSIVVQTIIKASYCDDFEKVDATFYKLRLHKLPLGNIDAIIYDQLRHLHFFEYLTANSPLKFG
jgi:hypothetical protein